MRSAIVAEATLAHLIGRSRAASTIGDLLETSNKQGGAISFWISFARILLSLIWRGPVAWIAGYALVILLWRSSLLSGYMRAPHRLLWSGVGLVTVFILLMVLPYSLLRYGRRDRFAQLASAMLALTAAATFLSQVPGLTLSCLSIAAAILIASLCSHAWRRPTLILLITVLVGCGITVGNLQIVVLRALEAHGHPIRSVGLFIVSCPSLLSIFVYTLICSRMHRRLL